MRDQCHELLDRRAGNVSRPTTLAVIACIVAMLVAPQANGAGDGTHRQGAGKGHKAPAYVEPEHVKLTRELGKASLEMSRAALSKIVDPKLRAFAKAEIEHEEDNEKIFGSQRDALKPVYAKARDQIAATEAGPGLDSFYRLVEEDILKKLFKSYAAYRKHGEDDMAYTISSIGKFQIQRRIDKLNGVNQDE